METVTEFLNELASKGVKLSAEAGRLNCYAPHGLLTADLRNGIARFEQRLDWNGLLRSVRLDHSSVSGDTFFPVTFAYRKADAAPLPQDAHLALEVLERESSFTVHLKYDRGFHARDTARRFLEHYC